ncbi:MAG: efflux RND transporter periplasmic adaptor subunit [Patescibacteria group bacterium]
MKHFLKTSWFIKLAIIIGFVAILFLANTYITKAQKQSVSYQSAEVEKGTLIVSVTGSGQVSTANNGTISTLATGVVSKLYVKDGDSVKTGDKIAEVDLDLQGKQNAQSALSNYQSAKNNLDTAKANMYSLQSTMFANWDSFMQIAQNGTYQNEDGSPNHINRSLPEFHIANDNWLAAEAKYKIQDNVVKQAQLAQSAAWSSYQQTSPTIYAPITGTVTGLSLQVGSVIVANTSTSNNAQSATKIASIKTQALPTVSINLTEIDIPKIELGDKATVTFDAFSDKTFTGQVVSIDTAGVVSSGVTTYPTVVRLDTESNTILPNMAASANIITNIKDDVLMVPSAAIQKKTDGTPYVLILQNKKPIEYTVETGLSSDTHTEIVSGLSEGDIVVINSVSTAKTQSTGTGSQSPFGGIGGGIRMRQ